MLNRDKRSTRSNFFPALPSVPLPHSMLPDADEKFRCEGVNYNGLATAVQFREGSILYYPKSSEEELAISFEFTGCVMAQFYYERTCYVAHIYLAQGHDTRESWNLFIKKSALFHRDIHDLTLFRPFTSINRDHLIRVGNNDLSVCGIIEGNTCYSCLMDKNDCTIKHCTRINDPIMRVTGKLRANNYHNVIIH